MTTSSAPGRALVVGATGIIGQTLSTQLAELGWETYGLSRSGTAAPGVTPVRADLGDAAALAAALDGVRPELVAITAWTRQDTEQRTSPSTAAPCATCSPRSNPRSQSATSH